MKKINVGMIGCGGFARALHIPILQENSKYRIHATMDLQKDIAEQVASEVQAEYSTSDVSRILDDKKIDAVFIITRHDSHADLTIQAAQAGKHIMCEKPMGLNAAECKAVADAVKSNGVKYTVGYNRGMARFITKASEMLKELADKKLIYHRIQAPFPADHWIHDPQIGGSRIIGEGCHIFDLICELADCEPKSVFAAGGLFLASEKVTVPDSGIVTIKFEDGSVGCTLIASAGCADLPKESTEIYCNGRGIHIDDFKAMTCCGFHEDEQTKITLKKQDKGHAVEIDKFADAILNDSQSPNGVVQAARAAIISFKVHESIEQGSVIPIQRKEYDFQGE